MPEASPHQGYCFDTSSIIHAWVRTYPPENFPSFWDKFAEEVEQDTIIAPEDVREELVHPADLRGWVDSRADMFRELDEEIQASLRDVLRYVKARLEEQGLTFRQKDLKADPIVVATARITARTVVVEETRRGNQGRPKVPDICDSFEVRCINLLDFIKERNWRF